MKTKAKSFANLAFWLLLGAGVISYFDGYPNGFQNYCVYLADFLFLVGAVAGSFALMTKMAKEEPTY